MGNTIQPTNSSNTGARPADRLPSGTEGTVNPVTPRTAQIAEPVPTDPHVKTSFSVGGDRLAFQRLVGGFPRT